MTRASLGLRFSSSARGFPKPGLSEFDGGAVSTSANFADLHSMQVYATQKFADRPLIGTKNTDGEFEWTTYKSFGDKVDNFREVLRSKGVCAGDKVGIISSNSLEWAITAYAAYGLNCAPVGGCCARKCLRHCRRPIDRELARAQPVPHHALFQRRFQCTSSKSERTGST